MSVRVVSALIFVIALSALAADISVGCGQPYVYGVVSQKYPRTGENDVWMLQIADESWGVPENFWHQVQLGDTVKFDGKTWSIVKTANGTVPANTTAPDVPPNVANPPGTTPSQTPHY
jgi:hypothetical protein